MEGEEERDSIRALLQEIRTTEVSQRKLIARLNRPLVTIFSLNVLETRILLLNQLEQSDTSNESELGCIAGCLITIWEESTVLELLSCKSNLTVLHVARKYVQLGVSVDNLSQFLILATKACMWCRRHLNMEISLFNGYQDERHLSLFLKLMLDSLSFSTSTILVLTRFPIFVGQMLMLIVENFVSEQLKLLKASVSEIKRINSIATEVLKFVQEGVDAAIRLCKAYSQTIDWDSPESLNKDDEGSMVSERGEKINHVTNIMSCTIEDLYELGIIAATGGGSLVTILNLSWKGVVMLLQPPNKILTKKINVADIIITLVSLATESLRCSANTWISMENVSLIAGEAKRALLPIKFYLINAVRISTIYPCQAWGVHKEISLCVLKFSALGLNLSKESNLKTATEAMTEFLEPVYFLLLQTLLGSAEIECHFKFQFLDWLFPDEIHSLSDNLDETHGPVHKPRNIVGDIFSVICDDKCSSKTLALGRASVFLNFLRNSSDLKEEVVLGISRKLHFMLDLVVMDDVYSSILDLHIPVLSGSGGMPEVVWQPMLPFVFNAFKAFMVVSASSSAWFEVKQFLLCHIIHPHYLCSEIVLELWCFLIRHAEEDLINDLIDRLCSLFNVTSNTGSVLLPHSAVRKMARSICIILKHAGQSTFQQVHQVILGQEGNGSASKMTHLAFLMEDYPFDLLSDEMKKCFMQQILTSFCGFIENVLRAQGGINSSRSGSGFLGEPLYALSTMLHHQHIKGAEISKFVPHILKFTVLVLQALNGSSNDISKRDSCGKLLCQALLIISSMKDAYLSHDIDGVILGLQTLFVTDSADSDFSLVYIKPALSSFLAGLCHMEIVESEENVISCAIWELYHKLLQDRDWTIVHLALAAFGYFAARTSCKQLWRFVPQDAALSFDKDTGKEANEERFMSELKAYLEKEAALVVESPSAEQRSLLEREAISIYEGIKQKLEIDHQNLKSTAMEVDDEKGHLAIKKRKFLHGIGEGVMLLQRGLQIMRDGVEQWQTQKDGSPELRRDISMHLSCLEDVVTHLVALERKAE